MKLTMMWLHGGDDDNNNDDNDNYNDNENDMNDDDDDDDPYKKVLDVEVNKPSLTTSSKIKMCSIIVITYTRFKL